VQGEAQCDIVRELFGIGIFTTDGDLWKEQRRVASYEFSSRMLREFSTDVFREYATKLVLHLARFAEPTQAFDLQDLCMRMTLDTTCRIGFGVELECLAPSLPRVPFAQCFEEANYISFHRFIDPLWKVKRALNLGSEKTLKECVKTLDDFTYGVIGKKRQQIASSTNQVPMTFRSTLLL
jgi:cytochrome P450